LHPDVSYELTNICISVGLRIYVDMNFFSYFDMGNLPLKFVLLLYLYILKIVAEYLATIQYPANLAELSSHFL